MFKIKVSLLTCMFASVPFLLLISGFVSYISSSIVALTLTILFYLLFCISKAINSIKKHQRQIDQICAITVSYLSAFLGFPFFANLISHHSRFSFIKILLFIITYEGLASLLTIYFEKWKEKISKEKLNT